MADIFISYSKADRDKVVVLAAYLESQGWTVWWDTNLAVGDAYRDEIMKELAAARAVIVLWTQNSIKSDFVRAEAGRAKADGKLIPVKDTDVNYGDIPLPFGEMHTEDLSKRQLIRAAVVAQLAKPAVQPSALWMATRTLRYQVLTWVGIVGGAITLFTNLREVLNLADWARWVVARWHEWAVAFWQTLAGWFRISIPPEIVPLANFASFSLLCAVGARFLAGRSGEQTTITRPLTRAAVWLLLVFAIFVCNILLLQTRTPWGGFIFGAMTIGGPAIAYVAVCRGERLAAAAVVGLILIFQVILFSTETAARAYMFLFPINVLWPVKSDGSYLKVFGFLVTLSMGVFFAVLMSLISPLNSLAKRMCFALVGLLILVALNQASLWGQYVGISLKPPLR